MEMENGGQKEKVEDIDGYFRWGREDEGKRNETSNNWLKMGN